MAISKIFQIIINQQLIENISIHHPKVNGIVHIPLIYSLKGYIFIEWGSHFFNFVFSLFVCVSVCMLVCHTGISNPLKRISRFYLTPPAFNILLLFNPPITPSATDKAQRAVQCAISILITGLDDALEGLCIKMHYIALTISTIKEKYLKALSMCRQPLRVSNTYLIQYTIIGVRSHCSHKNSFF